MEKVTIIIPVYNAEKYIDDVLTSVCGQTYSELEILLIDDGSADDSLNRCEEWAKKDARIRVFHQENSGVSDARNKGLELATGKYVMFMDSDDWIEKNMIEVLCKEAQKSQADAACCILQENPADENTGTKESVTTDFEGKITVGANQTESGLLLLKVWGPVCKLYRRDVIGDCRFENYKVAEDLLFNANVICSGRLQKVVFVEHPFYHYIIYPGSAMKQEFQEKYLVAMEVEKKCYDMLTAVSPEFADINLIGCSVSRVFEKYAQLSAEGRKKYKEDFKYCKKFAKEHRKQLLGSSSMHRKVSGALKVYVPNLYLQLLIRRYH
ncbi:MAG: glycosyltransferase family 2 protein [Roseburia sp.]|nr:glycosyltransferase family 2 protein [Roseburia sp.]